MRKWTGRLAGLAIVTVAVAGCRRGEATQDGPRIQTVAVSRGDLSIRAEATGTVEPIRQVEVKSKASGEILRLHADVGDEVEPGTLLAEIDPRDVANRYEQAVADLDVARARAEISQAQLGRSDRLLAAEVITAQEHENARLDYANARAQLVKATTNFELAELQLSDVRIRAPMAGTIIQKSVEEGVVIQSASQNVSGGTTLFIMADLADMQVRTLVDETDMGELRSGMEATVRVEAHADRTFQGVVEKIEPQATVVQNVTMFAVIVSLDNRAGLLRPGMNAEVEILIDRAIGVVLVPNNAIVQTSDVGPAAMVLGLDVEAMDLTPFLRAGRGRFAGAGGRGARGATGRGADPTASSRGGARRGTANPARDGGGESAAGENGGQDDATARIQALRAQVEAGEISQDSVRAVMQILRPQGGFGGDFGGSRAAGAQPWTDSAPPRETRPAVVFVMGADSLPEPRLIQVGLNDWDFTQVVGGLEEGEILAVVGAAQLQAQQQEFLDRMRDRSGGNPFGGGGRPGGRGGGGRR